MPGAKEMDRMKWAWVDLTAETSSFLIIEKKKPGIAHKYALK